MASAQPFPFPDRKAAPRAAAVPADPPRAKSLVGGPHRALPVLARIPDITIRPRPPVQDDGNNEPAEASAGKPHYRLDAAHSSAIDASESHLTKPRRATQQRPQAANSNLEELSTTIRFAVGAWDYLQPYQPVLRTAAMFLLMALSSMSVMLMVGPRWKPTAAPQPTAAEHSELAPPPASRSAQLEREPEASTMIVPTATGPGKQKYNPSDDDEPSPPTEPVASHHSEASEPPSELRLNGPLASHGPGAKSSAIVHYPTTPYPATNLSIVNAESLPEARMTDETPAVARLRGDILDSQPR